jgi:hypothetical protein
MLRRIGELGHRREKITGGRIQLHNKELHKFISAKYYSSD